MRKITFAVYNPPKEGLPYLAAVSAPTGAGCFVASPAIPLGMVVCRSELKSGQVCGAEDHPQALTGAASLFRP
jgi:hypothetical protein